MSKKKKNQGRADAEASSEASATPRKKVSQTTPKATVHHDTVDAPAAGEQALDAHGHHEATEAEDDKPKNGIIVAFILATCAVLVAMVIGVREMFVVIFDTEVNNKVLAVQSSDLRALRASEQQRLSHYQWVSQKDGVVRIPVDRAMELTLATYRNPPAAPMKEEPKPETTPKPEDTQSPGSDDTKGGEGKDAAAKDGKTGDAKDAAAGDEKKGSAADPKKDAPKEKKPETTPKPEEKKPEEPKK
ncbi:hypothetical protein [Polyangium aurulentum]|uniref:hypothetical protein n=1 Tax=Polyangium aurulentum TaxID=2567896 RepID=UPI0010AE8ADD|nr:hypothetical protein [Polyangium aurulentum]UQA57809.1 hypothetical protein E8A73_042115 [Polyangium aurulentum]